MAQYRKKPVVIDAVQWFPGIDIPGLQIDPSSGRPFCPTLEGPLNVSPGDWVITGVKGEKYPVKADIFAATYERVVDDPR